MPEVRNVTYQKLLDGKLLVVGEVEVGRVMVQVGAKVVKDTDGNEVAEPVYGDQPAFQLIRTHGHVEWTERYLPPSQLFIDDDPNSDRYGKPAKERDRPRKRRKMTTKEIADYCVFLLLEAAGVENEPVTVKLD